MFPMQLDRLIGTKIAIHINIHRWWPHFCTTTQLITKTIKFLITIHSTDDDRLSLPSRMPCHSDPIRPDPGSPFHRLCCCCCCCWLLCRSSRHLILLRTCLVVILQSFGYSYKHIRYTIRHSPISRSCISEVLICATQWCLLGALEFQPFRWGRSTAERFTKPIQRLSYRYS